MTDRNPFRNDSPAKRRTILKTLGVGALGASGLGGTASAAEGEQYAITGSDQLADGQVMDELEVARSNEAVQNFTSRMADRSLEMRPSEAVGVQLTTDTATVNGRNPTLIQIPYLADHGESVLHVGLVDDDAGVRTSYPEFGASLEGIDGETLSRHYTFEEVNPVVEQYTWIPEPYPLPISYWPPGWGACYPYYCYWSDGALYVCYNCWDYLWYYDYWYWPWHLGWYTYCEQVWP